MKNKTKLASSTHPQNTMKCTQLGNVYTDGEVYARNGLYKIKHSNTGVL